MRELPDSLRRRLLARGSGLQILVVRLGALGDILRALPMVRLLRTGLPDAGIRFVADDRWEPFLRGHGDLDGTVPLPRRRFHELSRSPARWADLIEELMRWRGSLRAVGAGLLLDFHGNLRSGIVGRFSGAPVRLGHDGHQQKEGNRLFTTHRVAAGERRVSRIERNLDLVRALGLPVDPLPDGGLPESAEDRDAARAVAAEMFGDTTPYAILNAGASALQAYKRPPRELLAAAAGSLHRSGIAAMVVHGPGEKEDALAAVEATGGFAALAPLTTLGVLAALLRRARMFVGGDTGPLHMACAVGCPVLGIYGPTDPVVNSPWGVPFEMVFPPDRVYTGIKRVDRTSGGFDGITSSHVEEGVSRLLAATLDYRR